MRTKTLLHTVRCDYVLISDYVYSLRALCILAVLAVSSIQGLVAHFNVSESRLHLDVTDCYATGMVLNFNAHKAMQLEWPLRA